MQGLQNVLCPHTAQTAHLPGVRPLCGSGDRWAGLCAGANATTVLVRRVKQGVAEWFRLQIKEKAWRGLREHSLGLLCSGDFDTCPEFQADVALLQPAPHFAGRALTSHFGWHNRREDRSD